MTETPLSSELKDDLTFNESNIHDKLSKLPVVTTKWSDRYIKCKNTLNKLEREKSEMTKIRTHWYSGRLKNDEGKFCPYDLTPQEIRDVYIPGDDNILLIREKIDRKKLELQFLDYALKQCNQIHWTMKSWIDWQKYINGAI